jgi:hypothetical protein
MHRMTLLKVLVAAPFGLLTALSASTLLNGWELTVSTRRIGLDADRLNFYLHRVERLARADLGYQGVPPYERGKQPYVNGAFRPYRSTNRTTFYGTRENLVDEADWPTPAMPPDTDPPTFIRRHTTVMVDRMWVLGPTMAAWIIAALLILGMLAQQNSKKLRQGFTVRTIGTHIDE